MEIQPARPALTSPPVRAQAALPEEPSLPRDQMEFRTPPGPLAQAGGSPAPSLPTNPSAEALANAASPGPAPRLAGSPALLQMQEPPAPAPASETNPPDVRDVELFTWARHRLGEAGLEPRRATRAALALIVLTLHKDLEQLRQAA